MTGVLGWVPLFDIIKDPERAAAEQQQLSVVEQHELIELAAQIDGETSEIQELRANAHAADARDTLTPMFELDSQAEYFLEVCLSRAREISVQPYRYDPNIGHGLDLRGTVRILAVPVMDGDWKQVLSGRESALATASELLRRGFLYPMHDFRRVAGRWELRIRFGF